MLLNELPVLFVFVCLCVCMLCDSVCVGGLHSLHASRCYQLEKDLFSPRETKDV